MKYIVLTILSTLTIVFSACDSVESLGLTVSSDDANVSDNPKLKERIAAVEESNSSSFLKLDEDIQKASISGLGGVLMLLGMVGLLFPRRRGTETVIKD